MKRGLADDNLKGDNTRNCDRSQVKLNQLCYIRYQLTFLHENSDGFIINCLFKIILPNSEPMS